MAPKKCSQCGAEVTGSGSICIQCDKELTDSSSPTAQASPGRTISLQFEPGQGFGERYTIVEEIGAGGMAQVYKAIDRDLERTVALKLIVPSKESTEMAERFRRELNLAREVTHRNVCRVFDMGKIEDIRFISMEHIDGQNLSDWIQAVGRLSPHQTMTVGGQICDGLEAIHHQSIVHRDLKPGNIMLDRSGRVVVMDFGLAYHPEADQITARGDALGTLAYLSPEQARGDSVDARSDIYSLGLVLFEMLTGRRPPADGKSLPLALRDSQETCPEPSQLVPEVPESLDRIVLSCLERDPEKRYSSVREVSSALEASSDLPNLPAHKQKQPAATMKKRGFSLALGIGALLLLAWLVWILWPTTALDGTTELAVRSLTYQGPEQNAYMGDLLPVMLIRNLERIPDLEIVPYDSSRTFGKDEDPQSIMTQLGVEAVAGGRIEVRDKRFEVRLQIDHADRTGRPIWSEVYAGNLNAFLTTADRISNEISTVMGQGMSSARGDLPQDALRRYLEGKSLLEGWDVEENHKLAAESFERALVETPDFPEAHSGLALALWKQYEETRRSELVERAFEEAQRGVSLGPTLPEAHLALGVIQLGRGRSVEAVASFEVAQSLAPADDAVCRRIADAYASLGREDEAERWYQHAIDLRPQYWEGYNFRGSHLVQLGRFDEAKEMFREVIRLRPESDTGYSNLAAVHMWTGELEEAENLLLAAIRIHPSHQAHNSLGFIYYSQKRFHDARQQFKRATLMAKGDALYHSNLGDAYRQLGQTQDAREAYRRAIDLGEARLAVNPDHAESRAELTMALAGSGDCDEARRNAVRADEDDPSNPTIDYYLAITYVICGDREAAIRHAAEAVKGGIDLDTSPDLEPLLSTPRLQELIR